MSKAATGNLKVYKYQFGIQDIVDVRMPDGAKILHVELQHGEPCMWALVDSKAETKWRRFYVRGTGHPVPESFSYIATIQMPPFVWHLFEERGAD